MRARPSGPVLAVVAIAWLLALASALGAGCTGDDDVTTKPPVASTSRPPVTEAVIGDVTPADPDETVDPSTSTTSTSFTSAATTLPDGLPQGLGIPGAANISLGGGSSISNRFAVRSVPFEEVVAFVAAELVELGWSVEPAARTDPNVAVMQFFGPGAFGQTTISAAADGTVAVAITLGGF